MAGLLSTHRQRMFQNSKEALGWCRIVKGRVFKRPEINEVLVEIWCDI